MDISTLAQLAATFIPITDAGNTSALTNALKGTSVPQLMQFLFDTSIVVGAMLAVLRITYAGFQYMVSDIANTKSRAISTIREALIGLVLLLAIVLILEQINPNLTRLDFVPATSGAAGTTR